MSILQGINTKNAPQAIGPYSQAIVLGDLIFTSGVLPVVPESGAIAGAAIEDQTRQALTNLSQLLSASGSSMENVVKTTLFIKDMKDFKRINDIYAGFFREPYPARSCVEVSRLPKDVRLQIDAVALKNR